MNDVLSLLGIEKNGNKYTCTKTIEEISAEMLDPSSPLYILFNNEMIKNCFPVAQVMYESSPKLYKRALQGKAIGEDFIKTISADGKFVESQTLKAIEENSLPSLTLLQDIEYSNSCPHSNNCPFLKVMKDAVVGMPCPVLIDLFLNNVIFFTNIILENFRKVEFINGGYVKYIDVPQTELSELLPMHKQAIAKCAALETKRQYQYSYDSDKLTFAITKGDISVTYVPNALSINNDKLPENYVKILANVGIDINSIGKAYLSVLTDRTKLINKNSVNRLEDKSSSIPVFPNM